MKLRATDIEISTAYFFGVRQNLIVPNVSWGFGLNYEADLLVIRPSGYAIEVEIKVDNQDLRNDSKKWKWMFSRPQTIKQFYFAVPAPMMDLCLEVAPEMAGIIIVSDDIGPPNYKKHVQIVRAAKVNKSARKLTDKEISNAQRLAAMRIWSLKQKLWEKSNAPTKTSKREGEI